MSKITKISTTILTCTVAGLLLAGCQTGNNTESKINIQELSQSTVTIKEKIIEKQKEEQSKQAYVEQRKEQRIIKAHLRTTSIDAGTTLKNSLTKSY